MFLSGMISKDKVCIWQLLHEAKRRRFGIWWIFRIVEPSSIGRTTYGWRSSQVSKPRGNGRLARIVMNVTPGFWRLSDRILAPAEQTFALKLGRLPHALHPNVPMTRTRKMPTSV